MGIGATIMDWAVTTIQALVPADDPDLRFHAVKTSKKENLPSVPGAHRALIIGLGDDHVTDPSGGLGAGDMLYVNTTLLIFVRYRIQGRSPHEAYGIACDDGDQILRALRDPAAYPSDTTGACILVDSGGEAIKDVSEDESTLDLLIPLRLKYRRD